MAMASPAGRASIGKTTVKVAPRPAPATLGAHPPAVKLHEVTDDGQPQPEAGVSPAPGAVGLPKSLEDVRKQIGGDAHAGVAHDEARLGAARESDRDGPARGRELERVGQDVLDHLAQAIGIAANRSGAHVDL